MQGTSNSTQKPPSGLCFIYSCFWERHCKINLEESFFIYPPFRFGKFQTLNRLLSIEIDFHFKSIFCFRRYSGYGRVALSCDVQTVYEIIAKQCVSVKISSGSRKLAGSTTIIPAAAPSPNQNALTPMKARTAQPGQSECSVRSHTEYFPPTDLGN